MVIQILKVTLIAILSAYAYDPPKRGQVDFFLTDKFTSHEISMKKEARLETMSSVKEIMKHQCRDAIIGGDGNLAQLSNLIFIGPHDVGSCMDFGI